MKYIDYTIKYIIRRLVRLIFKPKILLTILFILLLSFFVLKNQSHAMYGDTEYTDSNVVLYLYYDNINIDFVDRLSNSPQSNLYNDLINYLKNPSYSYYLYYGDINGQTMTGTTWNRDVLNIAFYKKNPTSSVSLYEQYYGLSPISYRTFTCDYVFQINSTGVFNLFGSNQVAFPLQLFNYRSSILTNFLYDNSDSNAQDIVSAIEEQTQATKEQTEKIEEQTEAMTSTEYDDSVVSIDSSSAGNVDNSSTNAIFTNLFSKFSGLLDSENWDSVSIITINLPFVPSGSEGITLRSDMLSSILSGGPLGTLITVSWYSLFGLYVFKFANKIYLAIKSGDILSGLSLNDEVITSTML